MTRSLHMTSPDHLRPLRDDPGIEGPDLRHLLALRFSRGVIDRKLARLNRQGRLNHHRTGRTYIYWPMPAQGAQ